MHHDVNYLLQAIERLTQPHRTMVPQTSERGISCVSVVSHDPLLKTLKDAIGGNVGRHANATLAREKTPLNIQAYEEFKKIAAEVHMWLRAWNHTKDGYEELWQGLARWYRVFENRRRQGRVRNEHERMVEHTILGWVRAIDNMFDPPEEFELTEIVNGRNVPVACPACGATTALNAAGDQVTAVVIEYRRPLAVDLSNAVGRCRNPDCGSLWRGGYGVREIRWLLDQADSAKATPEEVPA